MKPSPGFTEDNKWTLLKKIEYEMSLENDCKTVSESR